MAARDSVTEVPTKEIVIERVFDAPRERVFDVFTQPEHLQKWWGPKMFSVPISEFEARPGGKIFLGQRGPDGAMHYNAGVVREIVITRSFNAPCALVYGALTKAEHIKNWWGPRQYGAVSAVADFRAGGRYRYAQSGPGGEVAFSGEIRESSPERIVYTEEYEAMPGHGAVSTVTLDERGGKTFLTLRSVYQSKEDRDAVIASGMEWGARLSYLQLDEVIDSLGKAS